MNGNNKSKLKASILVLGNVSVGKTCLTNRFCNSEYSDKGINTIGVEVHVKRVKIDNQRVSIEIWDTNGQERFLQLAPSYYKNTEGIILVYSIAERESFENIEYWIKQIEQNSKKDVAKILVASKCDLKNSPDDVIESEEGRNLAEKHQIKFFETSAKKNLNVDDAFMEISRQIIAKNNPQTEAIKLSKKSMQETAPNAASSNNSCSC